MATTATWPTQPEGEGCGHDRGKRRPDADSSVTATAGGEKPTEVFGPLAEDYARFRPSYPDALFDALFARLGDPSGTVLDAGAGTGKATGSLLRRGARVVALEPNRSMLAQA